MWIDARSGMRLFRVGTSLLAMVRFAGSLHMGADVDGSRLVSNSPRRTAPSAFARIATAEAAMSSQNVLLPKVLSEK